MTDITEFFPPNTFKQNQTTMTDTTEIFPPNSLHLNPEKKEDLPKQIRELESQLEELKLRETNELKSKIDIIQCHINTPFEFETENTTLLTLTTEICSKISSSTFYVPRLTEAVESFYKQDSHKIFELKTLNLMPLLWTVNDPTCERNLWKRITHRALQYLLTEMTKIQHKYFGFQLKPEFK
jgi:hypothetical protein